MGRWLLVAGLVVMMVGVLMVAHGLIWWRLIQHLGSAHGHRPFPLAWIGLFVLVLPLGMAGIRLLPVAWARWCAGVTYGWLGLFFLLLLCSALFDGLAWLVWQLPFVPQLPQGALWRAMTAWPIVLLALGLAGYAHLLARQGPLLQKVVVDLPKLQPKHDGFTLVQISDLHVAPLLRKEYVQHVVNLVNEQQPDLVVLTGDLVDGEVPHLAEHVAPLKQLQARQGVYWITGNHEYYSGAKAWQDHFQQVLGIPCLNNRKVPIQGLHGEPTPESQTAPQPHQVAFELAGINDFSAHRFGQEHAARLDLATAQRLPDLPLVLLAHQPRHVFAATAAGVDLMLSGHTHGGQIWPFGYLVRLVQPHVVGLTQFGSTQLYVNRGTGYWGPPMRLWVRAEITHMTLRSSQKATQMSTAG